nr:ribosomal protein L16 [Ipomoea batatas]
MKGISSGGNHICFGKYALQALEPAWITSRQIEAGRRAMTRNARQWGQRYGHAIFPDKPVTELGNSGRYAHIGDIIVAVIKEAVPNMPLERSEVVRAYRAKAIPKEVSRGKWTYCCSTCTVVVVSVVLPPYRAEVFKGTAEKRDEPLSLARLKSPACIKCVSPYTQMLDSGGYATSSKVR